MVKQDTSSFVRARREWDDRYASLARGKRNWQLTAGGLLAVSLVLALALGWRATQSRITPYVVEVDRLGQAVAFGPAERLRATDERWIRYQLGVYLRDVRSVIGDAEVQKQNLERAYAFTRGAAISFLNAHYQRRNPFERAQAGSVRVQVESLLPLSEDSWQAQWSETAMGARGGEGETEHWQAVLTVELDPPETTETILENPLGLYVTEIRWTQSLGGTS